MKLLNTKSAAIHVYFRGIDNVIYHLRLQCNRSNNTPKNIVTLRNDTAMTVLKLILSWTPIQRSQLFTLSLSGSLFLSGLVETF